MCKKHVRFLHSFLALKKARPICVAAIAVFVCMLLCACANNVDSMIEDYNGHFVVEEKFVHSPGPGDEGFTANMMLYDEYFLYNDGTLIISAPPHCSNISWIFTDPDNKYSEVNVVLRAGFDHAGNIVRFTGTKWSGQQVILFVPESRLESPKTYKLTLTVTDEGGNTYTDSCGIVIYQRYDR